MPGVRVHRRRHAVTPVEALRTTSESDRHDVALVVQRGDEAAFRSLYGRHSPALYAFALRLMGGNAPEADDVMQDAWLRAVRSLGSFAWRSSLRTWLSTIVLNC
ncbi:MAG: hypothetical protein FJ202_02210 [Gemmatimonadetes bacterium]|nr:hypothetical protein [Gemmatimonadota bacterium]